MNLKRNFHQAAKLTPGIAAMLLAGFISLSATAATISYPQSFSAGWNLAGNGLTTPIDVKTTFGAQAGITTIWKWDAAATKWAFYAPSLDTAGTLASYAANKGYSVLTTINQGEGYWVNASTPVSLGTASGTGFSLASSNLVTGWNLAATADSIAPAAFTTNVGNVTTLWAWDNTNSAWYFYAPSLAVSNTLANYITSKNYKDFGALTLDNGRGFWVNYAGAGSGGTGGTSPIPGLMGGAIQSTPLAFATALAQVTTLAGKGNGGSFGTGGAVDATGTAASFSVPQGITTDGSNLYVTDVFNYKIRKIVIATGVVTTLAGSGAAGTADGTGVAASFSNPSGITTDGTNLYVTDLSINASNVRKIVIATGAVTTFAGTGAVGSVDATGTAASFNRPQGITTDGVNLYVADTINHKIRKIVIATGAVTTLAGSGTAGAVDATGTAASFNIPSSITTDGTNLYVVDRSNNKIRKIVISTGAVSTLAGGGETISGAVDGTGTAASFSNPSGITTDGTNLYVTDSGSKIRQIVISTAAVTTLAGGGGPGLYGAGFVDGTGTAAAFSDPARLTTDGANLYVADQSNNKIRKISATGGAPGGPTAPAALANITVTADSASQISINWVNVTGATAYNIYRSTAPSVQIIAGNKIATATAGPYANSGLTAGTLYYYRVTAVNAVGESAGSTEQAAKTSGTAPPVVVVAPTVTPGTKSGGAVMGALTLSGTVTPVTLTPALTIPPLMAALTTDGASMYAYADAPVSGAGIYKIDKASGATSLLAATIGNITALTSDGTNVFVLSYGTVGGVYGATTGAVFQITPAGVVTLVTTLPGYSASIYGIAVAGNNLYFAVAGSAYTAGEREIKKVDLTTKVVSTLTFGRNSCSGYMVCDGVGTNTASGTGATFNWLGAMTTDGTYLYVLEAANANPGIVRQISLADGSVKTMGGITRLLGANYASWLMGTGITTDGAGNVYVVNQASSQIVKYDIATNAASVVATGSAAGTNCASNKAPATCTGFHGGVTSDGTNLYTINGGTLVKIQ